MKTTTQKPNVSNKEVQEAMRRIPCNPSPLPWTLAASGRYGQRISIESSTEQIADMKVHRFGSADHIPQPQQQAANAELIIKAVNNHDDLVFALQTLVNLHDGLDNGGDGITEQDWRAAREVLKRLSSGVVA